MSPRLAVILAGLLALAGCMTVNVQVVQVPEGTDVNANIPGAVPHFPPPRPDNRWIEDRP